MQNVRILSMSPCRMVSSGAGMFGQERFDRFMAWMDQQERTLHPRDYLYWDDEIQGMCWLYEYSESLAVPEEFEVVDFPGGLYAVATDIDQRTDMEGMKAAVDAFLQAHGLERDPGRAELGNIISAPEVSAILGYEQMDYYAPVRKSEKL